MRTLIDEIRGGFAALAPGRFPYARFALAMIVGTAGGWAFASARLPLPWMLGPMTVCTLAALIRAPVVAPTVIRPPMTMVIGVLLGAAFKPDMIGHLPLWLTAIGGLFAFMLACGLGCVVFFRKVGGFDPTTAYFSGMPGGLVEMVILGEEKGGDGRTIALIHSARILLVVMTLPFIVQALEGVPLGARRPAGLSILETPIAADFWLLGCAILGVAVGHVLRLPAKYLLGPMFISAIVHVVGWNDFSPPAELVILAQLVLGVTIGCRFVGTPPREILRILGLSVGSTAILVSLTLIFAYLVSRISSFGVVPLILAYSPGGLAEMSLIALALNVEVAFVAAHHVLRVFLVMIGAGPLFGLVVRRFGRRDD